MPPFSIKETAASFFKILIYYSVCFQNHTVGRSRRAFAVGAQHEICLFKMAASRIFNVYNLFLISPHKKLAFFFWGVSTVLFDFIQVYA